MRVVNLMLGRGRGGLEQAAVDFAQALASQGVEVLSVTAPEAWANAGLDAAGLSRRSLSAGGLLDFAAPSRLRELVMPFRPTHVLCHGNRALKLVSAGMWRQVLPGCVSVGITHNYSLKHITRADHVLALTDDLARAVRAQGLSGNRVHRIVNLVRVPPDVPAARGAWRAPPVIGSMGRLVPKKGYEVLVEALASLAARRTAFQAVIGGAGEEEAALKAQAARLGLSGQLAFAGWVDDRQAFYDSIDIAVVPSHHEPFGIVVLEAMAQGLPLVSTASEGPREILADGRGGRLVPVGDALALADALGALLADPEGARALGRSAHGLALEQYDLGPAARRLVAALEAMG
jgi:glycosyltransferase involved in cell wall biosynthesis